MSTAPLQLERSLFDRFSVVACQDHVPEAPADGSHLHTRIGLGQHRDDPLKWRVELVVRVEREEGGTPPPYEIDARCMGFFAVSTSFPAQDAPRLVAVTGASILYSGLRELVALVTGRGPWGTYLLPTTTFSDLEPKNIESETELAPIIESALEDGERLTAEQIGRTVTVPDGLVRSTLRKMVADGRLVRAGRGLSARYSLTESQHSK